MPCHNASRFLPEAIESVLAQTVDDWELHVVDDASSDDSLAIARRYAAADGRVHVHPVPVKIGVAAARNLGLAASRGRYVAFLDADDVWLAHKLEVQMGFMWRTGTPLVFSAYELIDGTGVRLGLTPVPATVDYWKLLKTNVIGCSTAMYDSDRLGKVPMPLGTRREDFGLWLRLLRMIPHAAGLAEPLVRYRVHGGSSSANKLKMALENWRLYRDIESLPVPYAAWVFAHYSVRGVLRRTRVLGAGRKH